MSACRYDSLAPSMVHLGTWGKGDDRRMLHALHEGGYEEVFQVRLQPGCTLC